MSSLFTGIMCVRMCCRRQKTKERQSDSLIVFFVLCGNEFAQLHQCLCSLVIVNTLVLRQTPIAIFKSLKDILPDINSCKNITNIYLR